MARRRTQPYWFHFADVPSFQKSYDRLFTEFLLQKACDQLARSGTWIVVAPLFPDGPEYFLGVRREE
jgi:hypothetical protein